MPLSVFDDSSKYDLFIKTINSLSDKDANKGEMSSKERIDNIFSIIFESNDDILLINIYNMYEKFYETKINNRNGIWAYVLQNSSRPFFLREKFDIIVGNPPWLTFSDIEIRDYQENLRKLAEKYKMLPIPKNIPHLEIAALFLAHSVNYFLQKDGRISMVLPRSFFTGSQHELTRIGSTKGVKIDEIWDLEEVDNLFKVPTCVVFAKKIKNQQNLNRSKIQGLALKGQSIKQNTSILENYSSIDEIKGCFYLSNLGKNTAWTFNNCIKMDAINHYKDKFHQGATIVPRIFYFVDIDQQYEGDLKNRILNFRTSESILNDAKPPWKFVLHNQASTSFLFTTVLSNNLLPFTIINTRNILLPIKITNNNVSFLYPDYIEMKNDFYTSNWFRKVEESWEKFRTERNKGTSFIEYLNYRNKIGTQNFSSKYSVLYNTSGTNICSAIINKSEFSDFPFVADSKSYYFDTDIEDEAYYIVSFLNSPKTNTLIKPFQNKGIYGERDIHKKVLDLPLPQFNKKIDSHVELVEIGKIACSKSKQFLTERGQKHSNYNLNANNLGRLRSELRNYITKELSSIDQILIEVLKNI